MKEIVEQIHVNEGTLIINRHYMALRTPDGVLHPADLDEYGQYQPILELIRLISYNADMSSEITEETQLVLQQSFLGCHPRLSAPLYCSIVDAERNANILKTVSPKTEDDYVRVLSLICGSLNKQDVDCPFVCREDLRDYLCQFMEAGYAYGLSEAVRKGLLYGDCEEYRKEWEHYKIQLDLLPENTVNMLLRIKYLPEKSLMQRTIHYAILAANSMIKNNGDVIISLH